MRCTCQLFEGSLTDGAMQCIEIRNGYILKLSWSELDALVVLETAYGWLLVASCNNFNDVKVG